MSKRGFRGVAVLSLLAVLVAGCGGAQSAAAPGTAKTGSTAPAKPVVVRLATAAPSAVMASVWVAQDKGFFKRFGLDVHVTAIPNGPEAMPALLSGSEDFLQIDSVPTVLAAAGGSPVVIVATFFKRLTESLLVPAGTRSLKDLRGKSVGISKFGSPTDAFARLALEHAGLSSKDVTLLQLGSTANIFAALQTHQIAGGVLGVPWITAAEKKGFRELVNGAQGGPWAFTGITTTKTLVAKEPQVVKKVVQAEMAANAYMKSHARQTEQVIGAHLHVTDQQTLVLDYRNEILRYLSSNPTPSVNTVQPVIRFLSKTNVKVRSVTPQSVIDPQFVQAIRRG